MTSRARAAISAEVLRREHCVDEAEAVEVLGHLDAFWELVAVERLVDARAEEPDQGAGLGPGELTERPPGGKNPTRRRMPQVDEVGQTRVAVLHERLDDLDHLQEGDRALLHPRAARYRRCDERQPLGGGPFDRLGEAFGRGDPKGSAKEGELARDHAHAATADHAFPA